ncbi:hypothetical protein DHODJN_07210 [Methylorubrum extorquens]
MSVPPATTIGERNAMAVKMVVTSPWSEASSLCLPRRSIRSIGAVRILSVKSRLSAAWMRPPA